MSQNEDLVGKISSYHRETKELIEQFGRIERWIHDIADQTGVKLSTP